MRNDRPPRYDDQQRRMRPQDYDPSLADRIVDRIREGELLPEICGKDQDMPTAGTFLSWCRLDPMLETSYREARRIGNEVNFDEALIAAHGTDPQMSRVRSEALRWHVERSEPERYGPRAVVSTKKPEDDAGAGIDYSSEVRRRIEAMAAKVREAGEPGQPSS